MLIPGKAQGRGGQRLLSASQVHRSGLSSPKKGCFGAERWPGHGDLQVGGVALGFSLLSCSRGHHPSATASTQGPWPWPGAQGCRGGERGAAGLGEVPPTPWVAAALLPALAAMPALGVSLLFLAPCLASDTKLRYFCWAASAPNTQAQEHHEKKPYLGFFAPNFPALHPQNALLQPKAWGYSSTPFLRTQVKRNLCQLLGG